MTPSTTLDIPADGSAELTVKGGTAPYHAVAIDDNVEVFRGDMLDTGATFRVRLDASRGDTGSLLLGDQAGNEKAINVI